MQYKDLIVWEKSIDFVKKLYGFTSQFPKEEIYGLTSQMRRSAISIPSNIAEGRSRGTRKEFRQFLIVAYGSAAELETQFILSEHLGFGDTTKRTEATALLDEIMRMLKRAITSLGQ